MKTEQEMIEQTRRWIEKVVIACNFCPFAARELRQNTIRFSVVNQKKKSQCLDALIEEIIYLENNPQTETTLLILSHRVFESFEIYLNLLSLAEDWITQNGYEGIYQLASFHPDYQFADSDVDDPAHYTNRSIYPMFHILRESSITQALAQEIDPESIPERNIRFARQKGITYMQALRESCVKNSESEDS